MAATRTHIMTVSYCSNHFEHQRGRLGFRVPISFLHVQPIEQLTAIAKLHMKGWLYISNVNLAE